MDSSRSQGACSISLPQLHRAAPRYAAPPPPPTSYAAAPTSYAAAPSNTAAPKLAFSLKGKKKKMMKWQAAMLNQMMQFETDPNKLVNYVCGSNIYVTGEDVKLAADSEYPSWLWELLTEAADERAAAKRRNDKLRPDKEAKKKKKRSNEPDVKDIVDNTEAVDMDLGDSE